MATKTARKNEKADETANVPEPAEPPQSEEATSVETTETPDNGESVNNDENVENGTDDNEETADAVDPLVEEMNALPVPAVEFDDPRFLIRTTMENTLRVVHQIAEFEKVVLQNTLTDNAVELHMYESDSPAIAEPMSKHADIDAQIEELETKISALKDEQTALRKEAKEKARAELVETISPEKAEAAEAEIRKKKQIVGSFAQNILVVNSNTEETPTDEVVSWVKAIRRRVGIINPNTGSAPKASTSYRNRARSERMRKWAWRNGFSEVNEKGRIPQHVIDAYEEANPEDTIE
jgi:hypothetical protein